MRAASFSIAGPDGATADVSVVPIPGDSGSVLDNVNRWRSHVQLAPLASADDPALGKRAESPAGEIFVSHMTSTEPIANGKKAAIASAILKRHGMTWSFKNMLGIGLHSYGFTDAAYLWLSAFMISQVLIMCLALIRRGSPQKINL